MKTTILHRTCVMLFATAISAFAAGTSNAQYQYQSGYGSYYTGNVTAPGANIGANSMNRYLYDQYFYNKPSVSPYLNLARPGTDMATNYQTYVRPELQRREANEALSRAYVDQRKLEGKVGETRFPGAGFVGGTINDAYLKPLPKATTNPSSYYNHWYGGWNNR